MRNTRAITLGIAAILAVGACANPATSTAATTKAKTVCQSSPGGVAARFWGDVVAQVREATGGGAEVVVDTTPYAPQSVIHAIAIAVRKGRIVVAGLKGQRLTRELNADDLIYKELTLRGVLSMPVEETFRAVDIIASGRYPFDRLHTKSFPIEQAEEAIHALAGEVPGVNPVHLAIVPGAPRVRWSASPRVTSP